MNRKHWILLAISILTLLTVICWPAKKIDKKSPTASEIVGLLQEQSQLASTEVTIR